ncbi:MFS transporter [Microbacterium sp. NPDC055903]
MRISVQARRAALLIAFLVNGLGMATWVTRTPAIRDALGASTAEMGLILAGLSVGSLIGISLGAVSVARFGSRFVILVGTAGVATGVAVIGVSAAAGTGVGVAVGLALFGFGMGLGEIGLNVEGVEVEIAFGRSVVPLLHGGYSIGTVIGAVLGILANAIHLPVVVHLGIMALLIAVSMVFIYRGSLQGAGRTASSRGAEAAPASTASAWLNGRTLALAVIILGMALAEGSASDWLPLIVVDGFELDAVAGALIYAFFGLAMAIGRVGGGYVLDRVGRVIVMRTCAVVAAAGIALVAFAPTFWLAAVGVLLWGLGASLGFPVALSAAGDDPVHAARRASFVATAGYAAFLVGPPLLGFVGEHVTLRGAIVIVLAAVLATLFFADAVRSRAASEDEEAIVS